VELLGDIGFPDKHQAYVSPFRDEVFSMVTKGTMETFYTEKHGYGIVSRFNCLNA